MSDDISNAQYLRKCHITLKGTGGSSIDLAELHVKFQIHKADVGTPQFATIRIYNLDDNFAQSVSNEFTELIIQAGYSGNIATVFQGTIKQRRIGRENSTDTYLDLLAQDGDIAHNFSVVNTTIPAGWTQSDLMGRLASAYSAFDVSQGYSPNFKAPPMPRAKVCYGMTKNYLQSLADTSGCSWHVNNGQLNMVPINTPLPGPAINVNAGTGMIGAPRQTLNGIELRILINPQIKFRGLIRLNNKDIQQMQFDVAYNGGATGFIDPTNGQNTGLDADGLYIVYSINMSGDTRGQDWYFDLVCAAVGAQGPITTYWAAAVPSTTGF